VRAFGQELLEPRARLRNSIRTRDADGIEAARASRFEQGCLDAGRIVQKSRSV
jgi:hypothetical protein